MMYQDSSSLQGQQHLLYQQQYQLQTQQHQLAFQMIDQSKLKPFVLNGSGMKQDVIVMNKKSGNFFTGKQQDMNTIGDQGLPNIHNPQKRPRQGSTNVYSRGKLY